MKTQLVRCLPLAFLIILALPPMLAIVAASNIVNYGTDGDDTQINLGTTDPDTILQYGRGGNDDAIRFRRGRATTGWSRMVETGMISRRLSRGTGNDSIHQFGGKGDDTLLADGGSDNDWIFQSGGSGNDNITADGGLGNDYIYQTGGPGDDTY